MTEDADFAPRPVGPLSVAPEAVARLTHALGPLGAAGFQAFWSADSPEMQGGDVGYRLSTLPEDGDVDARPAASSIRSMVVRTGGAPLWIDPAIGDHATAELDAILQRSRAMGLDAVRLLALPVSGRVGICLIHGDTFDTDPKVMDRVFAAANAMLIAWHQESRPPVRETGTIYADRFSERERDVLRWCAEGKTNWEIARILDLSENTIRFHMKNILRKLDAPSRGAAVTLALSRGVIAPKRTDRKALLLDIYRAFIEGDIAPFLGVLDDEVVMVATAPSDLFDQGGRYEGRNAVLRHAATVAKNYDCRRFLPRMMIEDGDQLAVYLDVELFHRRSGNAMLFDCAHFWTFRDDRVVHYVELFNTAKAHRQMLDPAP